MSTLTTNYNLIKPDLTDPADITAMNANWDKIDNQLKSLSDDNASNNTALSNLDKKVDSQKTELTNKVTSEVSKLQTKITYGVDEPSGGNSGDVYIQIIEE
jgi:archaellum component FlaC